MAIPLRAASVKCSFLHTTRSILFDLILWRLQFRNRLPDFDDGLPPIAVSLCVNAGPLRPIVKTAALTHDLVIWLDRHEAGPVVSNLPLVLAELEH